MRRRLAFRLCLLLISMFSSLLFADDKPKHEPQYIVIVSPATGKLAGVDGGSAKHGALVIQWEPQKLAANQSWVLIPTDGEWFQIQNRKSGLVMAIAAGSENDGANVIQWPASKDALDHQWRAIPVKAAKGKNKMVQLENRKSGKLLSLEGESKRNGVRLVQSKEFTGARHQYWSLINVE